MYKRILVPLDGSARAERILPHVEALAAQFGATVTLLRAIRPPDPPSQSSPTGLLTPVVGIGSLDEVLKVETEQTAAYLNGVEIHLREHGLVVEHEAPVGSPAAIIVEWAETRHADLIAMTTHGRGGLARLLTGSVADSVLRHTPCPVLLVRVTDDEAAAEPAVDAAGAQAAVADAPKAP